MQIKFEIIEQLNSVQSKASKLHQNFPQQKKDKKAANLHEISGTVLSLSLLTVAAPLSLAEAAVREMKKAGNSIPKFKAYGPL